MRNLNLRYIVSNCTVSSANSFSFFFAQHYVYEIYQWVHVHVHLFLFWFNIQLYIALHL